MLTIILLCICSHVFSMRTTHDIKVEGDEYLRRGEYAYARLKYFTVLKNEKRNGMEHGDRAMRTHFNLAIAHYHVGEFDAAIK